MRPFYLLVAVVLVAACTPGLTLKKNAEFEKLNVCMEYMVDTDSSYATMLDSTVSAFINQYNRESHPFYLDGCSGSDEATLNLRIGETELVTEKKQTLATVVTAIGIALPIAMVASGSEFWVTFYYLPRNRTFVSIRLSDDIDASKPEAQRRLIESSPFYGDLNEQKVRQSASFAELMRGVMKELEKSYLKNQNKRGK